GAVAALLVLDVVLAVDAEDLRVLPADRGDRDHDATLRVAAEHEAVAVERDDRPLVRALEDLQRCHRRLPPKQLAGSVVKRAGAGNGRTLAFAQRAAARAGKE